ncbi:MAG: hypothetical protein IJX12_05345 [Lachnospiraceae bacterium]|nr:hypothetical protein [Lachnospiraceae bacterium]
MKNRKILALITGIASVLFMIIYTIVQRVGNWSGTYFWYIISSLLTLYSVYELLLGRNKGAANKLGIVLKILTCVLILLLIGTCIFLYMYSH